MFRKSRVHHQEDHLYMYFLLYVFHAEITFIVINAYTNGLPHDEHMIFETCRRHEELN